ncbi:MAG: hypothetical protein A2481_02765 [Candidatus Yonathbacteria bacterium RIFOXYC2_FULL_47_9]|nr:MAG: hypothetical protein A2481_02765 [Candidatus Yonathbacteria bacterium RIFOXYC2_FULL_47_9]HAT68313.1 hypothetical protein [Candidatus Yonathbacteria bacterium]
MKKSTLGFGAVALVLGTIGVFAGSALAYKGDATVKGPNYSAERHVAMEKAFESKDYDAWKNLMQGKGMVAQVINKDNFAKFAEAHELAEQGNMAEAQKIRQELGLGMHNGKAKEMGKKGMHRGMHR